VVKTKPRDYFDTPPTDEEDATTKSSKSSPEACQENEVITVSNPNTIEDDDTRILDTPQVEAEAEGVAMEGKLILHCEGNVEDEDEQQESESDDSEGGEYIDSDDEDSELKKK